MRVAEPLGRFETYTLRYSALIVSNVYCAPPLLFCGFLALLEAVEFRLWLNNSVRTLAPAFLGSVCTHSFNQATYSASFRPCRGCNMRPVVDGGVSALGAEWHVECFCCVVSSDPRTYLKAGR